MLVSRASLDKYVGKKIDSICTNAYTTSAQSHCAHFVGHALGIKLGILCGDMLYKTKRTGASIRCDELFNGLSNKGPWEDRPLPSDGLLIFVLSARYVRDGVMKNAAEKHVGIHFGGRVYNFSNTYHKVVVDLSVEQFHKKFQNNYSGGDISLYYGVPT
jgi:hypothetical protein